ncbi:MAG: L-sorbosone dehydrogenase [Bacteroidota bacterium]|nr:L-sorbosone dehydrogenase [Bacteroidota bacterium]
MHSLIRKLFLFMFILSYRNIFAQKDIPSSVVNHPKTIPFQSSFVTQLKVPDGWKITIAAMDLGKPRMLYSGSKGIIYATRRDAGNVLMLKDKNGDNKFDEMVIVTNFKGVHGITIKDGWMYLCNSDELRRYKMKADGTLEKNGHTLISGLPDAGQHPNRTIDFGPDGMLYMSIGSTCNDCKENAEMATIEQIDPKTWKRTIFASGLRNTIGFDWHPATHEMWGCDNGGDGKGEDFPPEEVNHLVKNGNYGFPYVYGKRVPDENHEAPTGDTKENYAKKTEPSVLELQAHMAPIAFRFFPKTASVPASYAGDGLVCFHGSWNRSVAVGYKVVRIKFENGVATGYEDFLSGFLMTDKKTQFGRPAGITITPQGVVYISDDTNGVIYAVRKVK